MFDLNTVHHTDALSLMRSFDDHSIDAYITDLPYGTTACKWDEIIPFEPMWKEVKRTLKPRGVFVTTASQPFTSALIMSNPKMLKHTWVWDKVSATGYQMVKHAPMKRHEDILVFGDGKVNYYPQMVKATKPRKSSPTTPTEYLNSTPKPLETYIRTHEYPKTILRFSNANHSGRLHPTQKPFALMEYLIRTYTQPDDLICDPCCGSGTTPLAARNLGRKFVACDTERKYVDISTKRLEQTYQPDMFLQGMVTDANA